MDRKEEKNLIDRLNSSINNQVPKKATEIFVNNKMKTNSNVNNFNSRAKSDRLEGQPCVEECNKETANYCETPVLKFTFDDCDFLTTKFKFVNRTIEARFENVSIQLFFDLFKESLTNNICFVTVKWRNGDKTMCTQLEEVSYCSESNDVCLKFIRTNYDYYGQEV